MSKLYSVAASEFAPVDHPDGLTLVLPGRHGPGQTDALLTKYVDANPVGIVAHHPFLVFQYQEETQSVHVAIVKSTAALLGYPDDTPVMFQWPGTFRSDWFHFTVGDYREHLRRQSPDVLERE